MAGLPTVQVQLDDGTGTFPFDITSKVLLSDGIKFDRGRQDWQGGVSAGSMTLTLNNSDGRFTVGSTFLGSPSPIKVDQRIRVRETVNGTTFTRFTGYVKQWPVKWPATVPTFATTQIIATDAQARAERWVLRSLPIEEISARSPQRLYPLDEPTGAVSAADVSGNQAATLTMRGTGTAVVFGVTGGSLYDSLTAAQFAAGQYLGSGESIGLTNTSTMSFLLTFSTSTAGAQVLMGDVPPASTQLLSINASNKLVAQLLGGGGSAVTVTSTASVNDGLVHTAIVTVSAGTMTLYLDGASQGSVAFTNGAVIWSLGASFTGILSYAAVFGTALSAGQAAAVDASLRTGFAGEAGSTRINRIAGYANLPVGTLDTSLTNVAYQDTGGGQTSAWESIQQAADAEFGVVFFDGSGNLIFHNRNRVSVKVTPDISLDKSYLTADLEPVVDDQQVLNYLEATAAATGVAQVARSTSSETTHGRYTNAVAYLVQTNPEALDRANWIITNFAEPSVRYGTLTINLYSMAPLVAATVLSAVEIDAWLRVTAMPLQTPGGSTADLVVEGYSEELTASGWTLTLNVVSRSLFTAWILGDTTQSVLGSTTRLYV